MEKFDHAMIGVDLICFDCEIKWSEKLGFFHLIDWSKFEKKKNKIYKKHDCPDCKKEMFDIRFAKLRFDEVCFDCDMKWNQDIGFHRYTLLDFCPWLT